MESTTIQHVCGAEISVSFRSRYRDQSDYLCTFAGSGRVVRVTVPDDYSRNVVAHDNDVPREYANSEAISAVRRHIADVLREGRNNAATA